MMTHYKIGLALVLLTASFAACNGREAKKTAAAGASAAQTPQANVNPKYGAPLQATAVRSGNELQIELSFGAAAERVRYASHGVNGVQIVGSDSGELASVVAGDRRMITIGFAHGDHPKGQVALIVSGAFGGREQSRAFSFGVADTADSGGLKQSDDADAKVITTDSQGRKIHVLPAK